MRLFRPPLPLDMANRELPAHLVPRTVSDDIVEHEFKPRPRTAAEVFRQLQLADPSEMLFLHSLVTQGGRYPAVNVWLAAVIGHFDRVNASPHIEDPSAAFGEAPAPNKSDLPKGKKKRRRGRKKAYDVDPLIPTYVKELRRQRKAGEERNNSEACRVALRNPPEGVIVPAALRQRLYSRTLIDRGNRAAAEAGIPENW